MLYVQRRGAVWVLVSAIVHASLSALSFCQDKNGGKSTLECLYLLVTPSNELIFSANFRSYTETLT